MITLHFSKANNSYCNFVIASSESKDELIPFLKDNDVSGDVWCLEGMYYPLILNYVIKQFPEPFGHHFVLKTIPTITPEELSVWIECSKQKIPMTGYDAVDLEYNTKSNTTTKDTTKEHLFQFWYNKNQENISFGSEFTPSEIVFN